MRRPKLYIASPLFSDPERSTNEAMALILERWCDVFLPQRDGYLLTSLIERGLAVGDAYSFVFKRDILAIDQCDAIIINLDGRTIDEGAAFELGYAYANSKLCVGYRTDVRVLLQYGLNPMITVPLERVLTSPVELEEWARLIALRDNGKSALAG
ncbi:MAG: nucleoside 2-deoxyribosyltransferase [Methylovirgula sp.]